MWPVFALDMLKGLLPTLAAGAILHFRAASAGENALWLTVGFATIFGHMFSLFLKFKGGKGFATSTGVILGVFPYYTCGAIAALTMPFIKIHEGMDMEGALMHLKTTARNLSKSLGG